jgi:UDPglucose 6-dehydrogenase
MKISVIGSGYVGLVAGTCFAENGHQVICVDNDESKIDALNGGRIPIYEPGLEEMVKRNIERERITFTTDLKTAVEQTLVCFIAVGTPPDEDGSSDLSAVLAVAKAIGKSMNDYKILVDKSTVPVGTASLVAEVVRSVTDHPFDVVSNPEFLKEGAAIDDFMKPDRVVIGADDPRVAEIMKELYAPFVRTGKPILVMDVHSAELTKYASNAMLATRISFMNELANLCEILGANIEQVRAGLGRDSRIGPSFLFAGAGYGGSCFPKDIKALLRTAADHGFDLRIVKAVEDVNDTQKGVLFDKIGKHFDGQLEGKTIAVWGLSFKPQTDDMREAPAIVLVNSLLDAGVTVRAHDPEAMREARRHFGDRITYCDKPYEALEGADALALVTEWNEYRYPDFDRIRETLNEPVLFDGRNIYFTHRLIEKGFTYYGIGVPDSARTE